MKRPELSCFQIKLSMEESTVSDKLVIFFVALSYNCYTNYLLECYAGRLKEKERERREGEKREIRGEEGDKGRRGRGRRERRGEENYHESITIRFITRNRLSHISDVITIRRIGRLSISGSISKGDGKRRGKSDGVVRILNLNSENIQVGSPSNRGGFIVSSCKCKFTVIWCKAPFFNATIWFGWCICIRSFLV